MGARKSSARRAPSLADAASNGASTMRVGDAAPSLDSRSKGRELPFADGEVGQTDVGEEGGSGVTGGVRAAMERRLPFGFGFSFLCNRSCSPRETIPYGKFGSPVFFEKGNEDLPVHRETHSIFFIHNANFSNRICSTRKRKKSQSHTSRDSISSSNPKPTVKERNNEKYTSSELSLQEGINRTCVDGDNHRSILGFSSQSRSSIHHL
jgi:hypothetical protein